MPTPKPQKPYTSRPPPSPPLPFPPPPRTQVQALSDYNISSLSLAQSHSMATTRDGRSTFVWGSDNHGSLGYGDGNWQQLPYRVPRELKTLPPELRAQR